MADLNEGFRPEDFGLEPGDEGDSSGGDAGGG